MIFTRGECDAGFRDALGGQVVNITLNVPSNNATNCIAPVEERAALHTVLKRWTMIAKVVPTRDICRQHLVLILLCPLFLVRLDIHIGM